jgi:DUF4097 and DUF4098 domain-containing protein YvlB
VSVQSDTGPIEIKNTNAQTLSVQTTEGDLIVDAYDNRKANTVLTTSTGNIELYLKNQPRGLFQVNSTKGLFSLNNKDTSTPYKTGTGQLSSIILGSETGNITVHYPT